MRALALLCAWSLAGCSSVSGPLDWVIPDEFTIGQGTQNLGGTFSDGVHDFDLDGEEVSTSAALTWDIPGIKRSDGMSRETQRNMALLVDKMVEDEIEEESKPSAWGVTTVDGEAPEVPTWLPLVLGGVVVIVLLAGVLFTRRQQSW